MWLRHRAWVPVAYGLSVFNVGATWFAAAPGEALHATTHALLAALLAAGGQYLAQRHKPGALSSDASVRALDSEKLDRIERSVDAIALEIERVGEGQRFLTKALTDPQHQPRT